MKKFIGIITGLFLLFSLTFVADANRTIYKNRGLPPHLFESALNLRAAQEFTSTGAWYRDPGVEFVLVVICAAGGGGAGDGAVNGGGGGAGGECKTEIVDVRGTTSETVTIGAVGAGGAATVDGSAGGASSFGALVTSRGGIGGNSDEGQGGGVANATYLGSGHGGSVEDDYQSGAGAYGVGAANGTGGGGGGSFGAGGATGAAAAANTGGGGGGGAQAGGAGGNGGTGYGIIIPLIITTTSIT